MPSEPKGRIAAMADASADGRAGTSAAISAEAGEAGLRLDRMLALRLPALSRSRLKRLIEEGHVVHDGTAARDPSFRVRTGQNFVVFFPDIEDAAPAAQPLALDIRFEDAHLIVIDKPAGLVVHPAPGNPDGTLVNALIAHCGASLAGIGGVRRPGIVHRLDKDTSGLMVVAKTEAAHQALSRDFALRRIDRAYAAFVWGAPAPATGEIAGNIGRSPSNRKKMAVVGEGRGRPALTRYRVERAFKTKAALIECRLATGRTHQIRVHLAHFGHPLIGDPVYGTRAGRAVARSCEVGARIAAFPRQALHARRLGFTHPAGAGQLEFDSPLPADLHALLSDLERL
jgi:23S rRNA pseudouridine1911/1915/1917 synthase